MLLRLGDIYLNKDKIVSIEDDDDDIYVFMELTASDLEEGAPPSYFIPKGPKAEAFRNYLQNNAVQIYVDDTGEDEQDEADETALVEAMNNGAGGVTYDIQLEYGGVQGGHYTNAPYVCEDCGDDGIVYHPVKK